MFIACQKIVQARLTASGLLVGRSNTPNHIGPVGGPAVRGYHGQSAGPPLPPHPASHGGSGAKSFDAQSHSSSGSGSAVPPPLTPTGMTAAHHVRVSISYAFLFAIVMVLSSCQDVVVIWPDIARKCLCKECIYSVS